MKKHFFKILLLAACLFSAVCFSACTNNETDNGEQQTEASGNLEVANKTYICYETGLQNLVFGENVDEATKELYTTNLENSMYPMYKTAVFYFEDDGTLTISFGEPWSGFIPTQHGAYEINGTLIEVKIFTTSMNGEIDTTSYQTVKITSDKNGLVYTQDYAETGVRYTLILYLKEAAV